ncbi:hypothetical protein BCH308197_C0004 (plasmid) [Bacillus cereus H3081.97]|nr:hypothetical protein BCH308197_C0004 [Bacillus cereus H3081.97]
MEARCKGLGAKRKGRSRTLYNENPCVSLCGLARPSSGSFRSTFPFLNVSTNGRSCLWPTFKREWNNVKGKQKSNHLM